MLPFQSKPKQTYVEIGDDAIGTLHFPVKFGLTPNELNLVEEATKDHKGYTKSILELADKLLKKWKNDITEAEFGFDVDKSDVGNSILRQINMLDLSEEMEKRKEQEALDDFIAAKFGDKDSKALTDTLKAISEETDEIRNAYIQAAMMFRFDTPEWEFEWGVDTAKCPDKGWTKPLANAVYKQMRIEEAGPQYDDKGDRIRKGEIVSDEEFKGFTVENVKKPAEESNQKELTGVGSIG